jgi:carbonic anhydrase
MTMRKHILFFLAMTALTMMILAQPTGAASPGKPHWDYSQQGRDWGQIQDVDGNFPYATCDTGSQQSPIDIDGVQRANLSEIRFSYRSTSLRIMNNSHTIQVGYEQASPASTITIDGKTYTLQQFHFHTQSEHTRAGDYTPAELHLVHKSSDGKLAVVGVQIRQSRSDNPTFDPILDYLPASETKDSHGDYVYVSYPGATVNTLDLLPEAREASSGEHRPYYTYSGSLTTPSCNEGVTWFVLKDYNYMSRSQISKLKAIKAMHDNYRTTQSSHGITVQLYEVN